MSDYSPSLPYYRHEKYKRLEQKVLEQEKTINELQQQKEDDRNYFTWEIRKQYIQIEKLVESIKKVKETLSNIKSKKTKTP